MSRMIRIFTITTTLFVPLIAMAESGEPIPVKGSEVWCAALSPDGKIAVTGAKEKPHALILWDVERSRELRVFPQTASVRQVLFSPDGRTIAAACHDKTVKLIDPVVGRIVGVLKHDDWVNGVWFSADGERLASDELSGIVRIWNVAEQEQVKSWKVGSVRPYAVGLSPDGTKLLSGGRGNMVEVWDVENVELLHTLEGHKDAIGSAVFSPDAKLIASASWDRTVKVWNAETGMLLGTLEGHGLKTERAAFSPDGSKLISCSADKTVKLWDVKAPAPARHG